MSKAGAGVRAVLVYSAGLQRRVAGMTLLERTVFALRRVGVDDVAVVVPAGLRAELDDRLPRSRLADAPPPLVEAPGDEDGLWALLAERWGTGGPVLVFTRPVAIDPGWVESILTRLRRDGGAGHLAGAVYAFAAGVPRDLAEASPRAAVPELPRQALRGAFTPVDDGRTGRRARRDLLAQTDKPLHIDGLVCYFFLRRCSRPVTTALLGTPITPNLITGFSVLLGIAAGVAAGVGGYLWPAIGGGLLMLSLLFDLCDGEVARTKYKFSDWGAWFDIYADFVVNISFIIGMAVGAFRTFDQPIYLYAGGFAVFSYSLYNGMVFRYIHRLGIPDEFLFKWWFDQQADAERERQEPEARAAVASTEGPSLLGRFLSGLKYMGRRDFFIFAYMVTALLGVLHIAFWVTVGGSVMNFVMTVYQGLIWRGLPDESS